MVVNVRNSAVLLLLVLLAGSCRQSEYNSFDEIEKRLQEHIRKESYRDAVHLLESTSTDFPEYEYRISSELARLYCKLGQSEKGFEIWEKGHEEELFYGIQIYGRSLENISDTSRFNLIVAEDERLRSAAIAKSKLTYEVILPKGYDRERQYPLIIVLHGGGSTIRIAKIYWQSTIIESDYIQLFIQSYLFYNMETFGWRIADERARTGIRECYEKIKSVYHIDESRVIIGGISAGGYTAMDIAIHNIIPTMAFLAVCPAIEPEDFQRSEIESVSQLGLKGEMIIGEHDHSLPYQLSFIESAKVAGLPVKLQLISGMGHDYPDDFSTRIDSAISRMTRGINP